jgi:hypothetical protein
MVEAAVATYREARYPIRMIDTKHGTARLLDFLSGQTMPSTSLCDLTGDRVKASVGALASGLERRVAEAWTLPAADLSCGQCRMLVGQRFGLQWLAQPVTTFVAMYPQAHCDLYPGDLTVISLVVWRDLATHAAEATRDMLSRDYDWLRREADEDEWAGSILKQAVAALDDARRN